MDPRTLTLRELRDRVGMVMPVWFPPEMSPEEMARILRGSLADVEAFFGPDHAVVVLDGAPHVEAVVDQLWHAAADRNSSPFNIVKTSTNRGKGGAVATGLATLLECPELDAFVIRDDDGDHLLQDVPAFHALLRQMEADTGSDLLLVNGRRSDLHWPLGWVRGQYELLLDDVVWSALEYAAAHHGWAVPRNYFGIFGRWPDLDSGYKMYSRAAAQMVVATTEAWAARRPGMLRWGCEVLPTVEIVTRRGWVGEVMRKTLAAQPLTTYGVGARWQTVNVEMLSWTFTRLELPGPVALQLFDNAILPLPLLQDREGFAELMALRDAVMDAAYPDHERLPWRRLGML